MKLWKKRLFEVLAILCVIAWTGFMWKKQSDELPSEKSKVGSVPMDSTVSIIGEDAKKLFTLVDDKIYFKDSTNSRLEILTHGAFDSIRRANRTLSLFKEQSVRALKSYDEDLKALSHKNQELQNSVEHSEAMYNRLVQEYKSLRDSMLSLKPDVDTVFVQPPPKLTRKQKRLIRNGNNKGS